MTLLLLIASQLIAAPVAQTYRFANATGLVEAGKLTPTGERILKTAAKDLPPRAKVNVVECSGAATGLGTAIAKLLPAAVPSLDVTEVARTIKPRNCPAGFVLEVSRGFDPKVTAVISAALGKASAQLPDGLVIPLTRGSRVPVGAVVSTGPDSSCTIQMPAGSLLLMRSDSQLALSNFQKGKEKREVSLRVLVGRLWARVSRRENEGPWEVITNNAVAGVRGTTLQVGVRAAAADTSTSLGVVEGEVGMAVGGEEKTVPAGFSLTAAGSKVGELVPLPSPPRGLTPARGVFDRQGRLRWAPVDVATAYRFELARDVGFNDIAYAKQIRGAGLEMQAVPGVYYWRVVAIDKNGMESLPSQLFEVRFGEKQADEEG